MAAGTGPPDDRGMFTSIVFGIGIVLAPALLVIALLVLLGVAVAGLADGVPNGLVRPNPR
jgi:hypothetical protein